MKHSKLNAGILKQSALLSKVTGQDTKAAQGVKISQAEKAVETKTGLSFSAKTIGYDEKNGKMRVVKLASTGKVAKILGAGENKLIALKAI